ncbi:MAG: D-glycero-beta-D-manno-heptose 1-phosphate adenylyltransferase [Bacteroidetes bacterium]|nr:D-glycero-beta-D-manno-heptose 1-phosphate adenylyltransferase [Bacteroidota bacterium]
MKRSDLILSKILSLTQAKQKVAQLRLISKTVAFTNGVFDILHQGHIYSLSQAAAEADFLIVGLNSDASVKRLKGNNRPVNSQDSRALILSSLAIVDMVVIFEEDTPAELIKSLKPDVLVKGGDYSVDQIAGAKEVIAYGGRVVINPLLEGFSTTSFIQRMQKK